MVSTQPYVNQKSGGRPSITGYWIPQCITRLSSVFQWLFPGRRYKLEFGDHHGSRESLPGKCSPLLPFPRPMKHVRTLLSSETDPSGETTVCNLNKRDVCPGPLGELKVTDDLIRRGKKMGLS